MEVPGRIAEVVPVAAALAGRKGLGQRILQVPHESGSMGVRRRRPGDIRRRMEDSFNLGPTFGRQHRLPIKASAPHVASAARGVEGHINVCAGGNMINVCLTSMNGRIRPGGDMPCLAMPSGKQ